MIKLYRDIDQVTEDTMKRMHNAFSGCILIDMGNLYMRSNTISIIFSVSLIGLSSLIFLGIHFGFIKQIDKIIDIL